MPVHEGAVGIVFPGPHVKRVERGQAKTIGALEIMEELSHERASIVIVLRSRASDPVVRAWSRGIGSPGQEPILNVGIA